MEGLRAASWEPKGGTGLQGLTTQRAGLFIQSEHVPYISGIHSRGTVMPPTLPFLPRCLFISDSTCVSCQHPAVPEILEPGPWAQSSLPRLRRGSGQAARSCTGACKKGQSLVGRAVLLLLAQSCFPLVFSTEEPMSVCAKIQHEAGLLLCEPSALSALFC